MSSLSYVLLTHSLTRCFITDNVTLTIGLMEKTKTFESMHPNHHVMSSNALLGLFTKMRDKETHPVDFQFFAKRAMNLLAEETISYLPSVNQMISTPCGPYLGTFFETENLCAVSIIRSGDALLESFRDCIPGLAVGKILIQRNESSKEKEAQFYYSKMPPGISDMNIIICDPMLATGGSILAAIECLVGTYKVQTNRIIFANMICCPEGLKAVAEAYPEVIIVTACVDGGLNEEKYIVPGLGDYGDRFFNTVS